jgi:hypothetical protein
MANSEAKLKSSGDNASPCFRLIWIGKLSNVYQGRRVHGCGGSIASL